MQGKFCTQFCRHGIQLTLLFLLLFQGRLWAADVADGVWGLRFRFSPGSEVSSSFGSGSALTSGIEGIYQRGMGEWGRFPWGLSFSAGLSRSSISETVAEDFRFEVTNTTLTGQGGVFVDLFQKERWDLRAAGGPLIMWLNTDFEYGGLSDSVSEFEVALGLELVAGYQWNQRLTLTSGLHYVTQPDTTSSTLSLAQNSLSYSLGCRYRF